MPFSRDEVLQQALALPPEDRAAVAIALAKSVGVEGEVVTVEDASAASAATLAGTELLRELQRRSMAFRNGQSLARPASEVLAELFP